MAADGTKKSETVAVNRWTPGSGRNVSPPRTAGQLFDRGLNFCLGMVVGAILVVLALNVFGLLGVALESGPQDGLEPALGAGLFGVALVLLLVVITRRIKKLRMKKRQVQTRR